MDRFQRNTIRSFRNIKKDITELKEQIYKICEKYEELKEQIMKSAKKNKTPAKKK